MNAPLVQLELSHRNHFKFGYNGKWFNERSSEQDEWCVSYGRCGRAVADWRAECIETARLIRSSTSQDLWVLFSGGIDSEVVLQSFMFSQISFKVAITCFRNDLNRQDVRYAIKFCETHQISYRLLHLDIVDFFKSGQAMECATLTKCVQPQLLHTMWAMDQVEGYPILGSGECFVVKRDAEQGEPARWDMFEKERIAAWYRHLLLRRREGCAGFFQYTPEVMLAFLLDEDIKQLCGNKLEDVANSMPIKGAIYRKYFLLEQRNKYHGFENVLHLDDELRPELERRFGAYNGIFRTEYADLVSELSPCQ
jgi:hypothetical protein